MRCRCVRDVCFVVVVAGEGIGALLSVSVLLNALFCSMEACWKHIVWAANVLITRFKAPEYISFVKSTPP